MREIEWDFDENFRSRRDLISLSVKDPSVITQFGVR